MRAGPLQGSAIRLFQRVQQVEGARELLLHLGELELCVGDHLRGSFRHETLVGELRLRTGDPSLQVLLLFFELDPLGGDVDQVGQRQIDRAEFADLRRGRAVLREVEFIQRKFDRFGVQQALQRGFLPP